MEKVKLKTETPPTRCEVCHQSDMFDPEKNYCARCKDSTGMILNSTPETSQNKDKNSTPEEQPNMGDNPLAVALVNTIILGFFIGLALTGTFHFYEIANVALFVDATFVAWINLYESKNPSTANKKHKGLLTLKMASLLFITITFFITMMAEIYALIIGSFSYFTMVILIVYAVIISSYFIKFQKLRDEINGKEPSVDNNLMH